MDHATSRVASSSAQPSRPSTNTILVRRNQKENPLLKSFHNVAWAFGDIVVDYQVGLTTGVIFLSLKYHRLHPEYVHTRIEQLQKKYTLRILLILCDVGDQHEQPIRELTKVCLINELTIIVAWSFEEAAIYLQTYKAYEHKSADSIRERVDNDYSSVLRAALTSIKGVNKTDVTTLRTHFGAFANIARATPEELSNCPGIGGVKVRRINEAFNQPFNRAASSSTSKGKGKAAPPSSLLNLPSTASSSSSSAPARREPSPDWDIDPSTFYNTSSDSDISPPPPNQKQKQRSSDRERRPEPPPWEITTETEERQHSPDWDIQLDLNESGSDEEGEGATSTSSQNVPKPLNPRKAKGKGKAAEGPPPKKRIRLSPSP